MIRIEKKKMSSYCYLDSNEKRIVVDITRRLIGPLFYLNAS